MEVDEAGGLESCYFWALDVELDILVTERNGAAFFA